MSELQPAHSDCGPSALKRRMECPGSRNAERGLPDRASYDAAEGSVFHEVAALCLMFGLEPDDFLDQEFEQDGYTFTFDESFAQHMRPGLDRVRELVTGADQTFIEQRVDISPWTEPGQFGTTDVAAVFFDKKLIRCHDWKYGEGVGVEAEGNVQASAYVLGVWNELGIEDPEGWTVEIIIDQMRRPEGGGVWHTDMVNILLIGEDIRRAVEATRDPNAPRHAGFDQCFFCKAKGRCAELARFNMEQAAMKFEDLDSFDAQADALGFEPELTPPVVADLTPDQISRIVRNAPLWSMWLRSVHEVALEQLLQGHTIPGLKAVPGRAGHRIWLKPEDAERVLKKRLGEDAYTRKLISPAQVEKQLGKAAAAEYEILWTQRDTKPSLVADTDDREAVEPHTAKFENLEESE